MFAALGVHVDLVDARPGILPFLDFEIRLDAGAEEVALSLTGPDGTKEVLGSLIGDGADYSRVPMRYRWLRERIKIDPSDTAIDARVALSSSLVASWRNVVPGAITVVVPSSL